MRTAINGLLIGLMWVGCGDGDIRKPIDTGPAQDSGSVDADGDGTTGDADADGGGRHQ